MHKYTIKKGDKTISQSTKVRRSFYEKRTFIIESKAILVSVLWQLAQMGKSTQSGLF